MIQFMIPPDAISEMEMGHIKFLGIQDSKVKTLLEVLDAIEQIPVESKLELETNVLDALGEIVARLRK